MFKTPTVLFTFAAAALFALSTQAALVAYFPVDSATDSSTFLDDVIDDATHGVADGTSTSTAGAIIIDATRGGDVLSTVQGHRYTAGTQDIDLAEGFTWAFWVKSDSQANADAGSDVIIGSRNGTWNKVQPTGTQRFFDLLGYNLDDDTWHHVAYTGSTAANPSGELADFWIDGVKVASDTNGSLSNLQAINDVMEIGGSSKFGEDWTGLLDDIAIWNEVLSDSDIQGLANGTLSPNSWLIPEPASLALLGLGGLMIARRSRKS